MLNHPGPDGCPPDCQIFPDSRMLNCDDKAHSPHEKRQFGAQTARVSIEIYIPTLHAPVQGNLVSRTASGETQSASFRDSVLPT